jgi:hypothetical protein
MASTSNSVWLPGRSLRPFSSITRRPDDRESMFQLKVVEDGACGNNVFEECPKGGDIPLAVAQLIKEPVLGFFGKDLKSLIKGAVRGSDA